MHPLLERQLKKCFNQTADFLPEMARFVRMVEEAYSQNDSDRELLEHSMELSSRELYARNQMLAQAEQKYRSIFEHATEGIFQVSKDGQIISANPALAAILGYDTAEQLKEQIHDIGQQVYVKPGRWQELVKSICRDGRVSQLESQVRRKDGTIVWISETTHAVYAGEGAQATLSHFEGTIRDVTRRIQSEEERAELQKRLVGLSRAAGKAEVASSVLHNVGNVLNSVNVSVGAVCEKLQQSSLAKLIRVVDLMREHQADMGEFLTVNEKGRQIPRFLELIVSSMQKEVASALEEMNSLNTNVDHIKRVIGAQQDNAKSAALIENVAISQLLSDALNVSIFPQDRATLQIEHDVEEGLQGMTDQHNLLQILINLLGNAKHALRASGKEDKILRIRAHELQRTDTRWLRIEISDNGVGIPKENLERIFTHGFSTKKDGHGFGLHASALAARQLKGNLTAFSEGEGEGATFVLEFPFQAECSGAKS
jgi:PAS domain S-box-containing protein